ncbi:GNAT family N-acetyltransferase [Micromonospora sp. C51]|uniref:GNAT family N-acetyltransferase n=1 Tax=Micromonospora sp. C51 TaxID=2824879 RepID=UPI001B388895|nr:GNAT family N-acetyltransferase [Micromonospora sp. C51]MBQ1048145.1 GNAT family N-acetyltransferase [Micromonospora sp. C51]
MTDALGDAAMSPIDDLMIRAARHVDLDGLGELAGSRDRAEVRLQAAERGEEAMLVAVAADHVVGVVSVRWRDGCDAPNPWLYGLAVVAPARRRGVGRALVEAGEAAGVARGAAAMSLDVDVDDVAAIAFYQRLGYVVVRPHQHRWRALDPRTGAVTGEGTVSTWIMRRHLPGA